MKPPVFTNPAGERVQASARTTRRSVRGSWRLLASVLPLTWAATSSAQTAANDCYSEDRVHASDAGDRERFGYCTALEEDVMVVGAPGWFALGDQGKAYAYARTGAGWVEQLLVPSDSAPEDGFGTACAVDGKTIVVGAYGNDHLDPGSFFNDAGAVYVFETDELGWVETQRLTAFDAKPNDFFGYSVALQGSTLVIGAAAKNEENFSSGAVYVYTRSRTGFVLETKLVSNEPLLGGFGTRVAVDGNRIAVGAVGVGSFGPEAVYVFVKEGDSWIQEARLVSTDWQPDDNFTAVALDGDTLVVGAPGDDDACPTSMLCQSGSAYVFQRIDGVWVQRVKLKPAPNQQFANNAFGLSVDVVDDVVVVGAPSFGFGVGWVYFFTERNGNWTRMGRVQAEGTVMNDLFGHSVSLSSTYELAAGAPGQSSLAPAAGASFVFRTDPACRRLSWIR